MKGIFQRRRPFGVIIRLAIIVLLLAITYAYAMFQGGFVSWFLFYSFFPFACYAIAITAYPLKSLNVERVITNKTLHDGDIIQVNIQIRRKFPIPLLFLLVEDLVPKEMDEVKQIVFPGFKREINLSFKMKVHRGEHRWNEIRLVTGDPLGFIEKETRFQLPERILVYPRFEEMIYRSLESNYEQGTAVNSYQFQKDTFLVAGIREYQPGDRFTWIDWKATARTNEMMTKEFETRQTNDLLFVLDRKNSEHFEVAVSFALSLARAILRHGGQIGFFSVGKERTMIPISSGEYHLQEISLHLAKVKADSKVKLPRIITEESTLSNHPGTIIIITTKLDQRFVDEVIFALRQKSKVIIFNVKKKNSTNTNEETQFKINAMHRGIHVKTVYEGQFRTALTEVMQA